MHVHINRSQYQRNLIHRKLININKVIVNINGGSDMVYQGSKNRLAKYIIPILQGYIDKYGITTFVDPFWGNIVDIPN